MSEEKKLVYQETKSQSVLEWLIAQPGGLLRYPLELTVCLASISLSLYHLYVACAGALEAHSFRSTHLAFILVLCFLLRPLGRKKWTDPKNWWFALDLLFIALVIAIQLYVVWDIEKFILRQGDLNDIDYWAGTILIGLLLEATRRAVGWSMVIIASFFLLHSTFSNWFPGPLHAPPSDWFTILDYQFMAENGIFGIPIMAMATYIFLFILFGSFLVRSGAGRFFINVAVALTGGRVGGPAKAAVLGSCMMGMVSGSAVANVVTVGTFTIPLMKSSGYRPAFAGAVEACASSGGQIMPPVMGAAAFIIAEFLNTPYLKVALSSLFPALMYFFTVFVMVHFEARKTGMAVLSKEDLPDLKAELKRGGHLFLSVILIVVLMILGFTPMFAAFWAILCTIALSFLRRDTWMSPVDMLSALEGAAREAVSVSLACACAGIIIGCVFVSGLGLKLTTILVGLSGGHLWLLLILTAIVAIILGMGLTTTAVYITLAALVIPAIQNMGVAPISAHLFAFYFGLVSAITPPVALASFAAAGIAGANPMSTGFISMRLGISKYILPFVFVYNPSMLFVGEWPQILSAILSGFGGLYALTVASEGWMLEKVGWPTRIACIGAAALQFHPDMWTDLAGWVILFAVLSPHVIKVMRARREVLA
ncbi:MAG: TRAP transporter permease [Pseudomonadota bacterium]